MAVHPVVEKVTQRIIQRSGLRARLTWRIWTPRA